MWCRELVTHDKFYAFECDMASVVTLDFCVRDAAGEVTRLKCRYAMQMSHIQDATSKIYLAVS